MQKTISILALIASMISAGAGVLHVINPEYAIIATAVAAAISAFTDKVQGSNSSTTGE